MTTRTRKEIDTLGRCNQNKRGPKVVSPKDIEWAAKMAAIRRNAKGDHIDYK